MREIFRILKPRGWANLDLPIIAVSSEDHLLQHMNARKSFDKRPDEHVGAYGEDYPDLLTSTGFNVEITYPKDLFQAEELKRMALDVPITEVIFLGDKPVVVSNG